MSDVDISPETPNFLARVDYELSVEGRTSVLEGVGKKKFRWEDVASSRLAMIAGLRASLTATQEKLAAAQEACRIGAAAIATLREEKHNLLEELTTTQAQIEAARNEGLEEAARWHDAKSSMFGSELARTSVDNPSYAQACGQLAALHSEYATTIRALKSTPHAPVRDDALSKAVADARARYDAMTPEQKVAHDKAQKESFVRGMMPTGDPRFD